VSFDIFPSNIPHRAGGQTYLMGFTDHFSSRRQKLYLLANKSDARTTRSSATPTGAHQWLSGRPGRSLSPTCLNIRRENKAGNKAVSEGRRPANI
jgi:hypothetical protein